VLSLEARLAPRIPQGMRTGVLYFLVRKISVIKALTVITSS